MMRAAAAPAGHDVPDARRVEEAGLNYLHSRRQLFHDGWVLFLSPGTAKRARSVNAHFGSTLPLAAKIAQRMPASLRPIRLSGGRSVARTAMSASRFERLSGSLPTTMSRLISG